MDKSEVAADLAFFGAPEDLQQQVLARDDEDEEDGAVEIHSDNAPAFTLFDALSSQWRTAVLSGRGVSMVQKTGLDYGAAETVARIMNITLNKDNFGRLRILENAALAAWGEDFARSVRK